MYYDNGAWQEYAADNTYDAAAARADVPSDPRYQWYNNQWWYWLPTNRWSYYDHGGWRDAAPGVGPERRETGYRGVLNNNEQRGPDRVEGSRDVREAAPGPEIRGPAKAAPQIEAGPRK
jgi:hypothetical protein